MEQFRDVEGYHGVYQVSNEGNLRKIIQYKDGTIVTKRKMPAEGSCSFRVVFSDSKGKKVNLSLAQVMLETFGIPKPPEADTYFYVASYRDGDWHNVELSNLYWRRRNRTKKEKIA